MTRGEKLARLVTRMVLALPPRTAPTDDNETPEERERRLEAESRALLEWLRERLARFAVGDWLTLLADARAAWPARRSADRPNADEDDDNRAAETANRACEAARTGRISGARQALCSSGLLPGTDATRREVEHLLRPVGRNPPTGAG